MPLKERPAHFKSKYAKARHNFLAAAEGATHVRSWQHPLRGIAGEKLYLDLAWFGSLTAPKVLLLVSGTHGVEGYCGSGIQVGSIATGWQRQADSELAIVMIHGLNPYGMSLFRRVNEDGVDLNRNFIDFQQPLPTNPLYEQLADAIIPQEWTEAVQTETLEQITAYIYQTPSAASDLAKGQYSHWYAPFYGGAAPTWSHRILLEICDRYLHHKQAVGLLDYHTGLGQYATGQLIGMPCANAGADLARQVWEDRLAVAGSERSVAAYTPQGTLIAALQNKLAPVPCIAAVYEFGTISEPEVFDALRADHWLHAYGDLDTQQAIEIKRNMLRAFYSDAPDWQKSVCDLAFTAQSELLQGLKLI